MTIEYNKSNPFLCKIKERYSLCKSGSNKNTQHLVLDLQGSGLSYEVGDSIAVIPVNDDDLVKRTLHAMKLNGEEVVTERNSDKQWQFSEYLLKKANLATLSKKLMTELMNRQSDHVKKAQLQELLKDGHKQLLANYTEVRHIWDALLENVEVTFTAQEWVSLLMPLLPRFYSIASSMKAVKDEVHLTIASLEYVSNDHLRHGVCTRYLLHTIPLEESVVPIYVQPHHGFTLPNDLTVPIIMVGPGTGVAPFRAFMQERVHTNASGLNWLFFGEWNRERNFFYSDFWQELESAGKLRLDVAFSRDQEHKVYVQHRLLDRGAEVFEWLEKGAFFYVCGDAHKMAKDVDAALHQIIQEHGKMDEAGAKEYVKHMRTEKRYLRDVY